MSHLIRGAWIEIPNALNVEATSKSHLIRGAWIEITPSLGIKTHGLSRISYEVRGLKSPIDRHNGVPNWSHLIRGAWIEINF